jgi:hypothetical protein
MRREGIVRLGSESILEEVWWLAMALAS